MAKGALLTLNASPAPVVSTTSTVGEVPTNSSAPLRAMAPDLPVVTTTKPPGRILPEMKTIAS